LPATAPRSSCSWLNSLIRLNELAWAEIARPVSLGGGDWTRPPCAAALCSPPVACDDDPDTPAGVMVMVSARPIRFEGQF
jgi:hypothetical protein